MTKENESNNIITYKSKVVMKQLLILPIIVLLIGVSIFGDPIQIYNEICIFADKGLHITASDFPTLSETIYYMISMYSVVITVIFSFLLYKVTERSNSISEQNIKLTERSNNISEENIKLTQANMKLTEEMINKEKRREKEQIIETTMIIYYDLLLGLNDIKKLYIGRSTRNRDNVPRRLFLSDKWINNVAILRDEIEKVRSASNNDYIEELYLLYGDLETVKDIISTIKDIIPTEKEEMKKADDKLYNLVIELAEKVFNDKLKQELVEVKEFYDEFPHMTGESGKKNYENLQGNRNKSIWSSETKIMYEEYPKIKILEDKLLEMKSKKLDIENDLESNYIKMIKMLEKIKSNK